ncbi:MAG: hypothetical protein ABIN96_08815 [Rubrivivax sp.]
MSPLHAQPEPDPVALSAVVAPAGSQLQQQVAATAAQGRRAPAGADEKPVASRTLSVPLGPRARLSYEPARRAPIPALDAADRDRTAPAIALQFQSPRSDSPRNLLKLQLSGGGVMQFRPRGGGLAVRYQTRF